MAEQITVHYSKDGQTLALYGSDGLLKAVGSREDVIDAITSMMNIKQVFDEAFLLGGNTPAVNVEAIREYKIQQNATEAAIMRGRAMDLLRQANELDGGNSELVP